MHFSCVLITDGANLPKRPAWHYVGTTSFRPLPVLHQWVEVVPPLHLAVQCQPITASVPEHDYDPEAPRPLSTIPGPLLHCATGLWKKLGCELYTRPRRPTISFCWIEGHTSVPWWKLELPILIILQRLWSNKRPRVAVVPACKCTEREWCIQMREMPSRRPKKRLSKYSFDLNISLLGLGFLNPTFSTLWPDTNWSR